MKVSDLIDKLKDLPQDTDVVIHAFGFSQFDIDGVWLTRGGSVSLGSADEQVTRLQDRTPESTHLDNERIIDVRQMLGLPEDEVDEEEIEPSSSGPCSITTTEHHWTNADGDRMLTTIITGGPIALTPKLVVSNGER